jgi:hypothetical protein
MANPEDTEANAAGAETSASGEVKANEAQAEARADAQAAAESADGKPKQVASTVKSGTLIVPVRAPEFSAGERFTADEEEPEVTEATVIGSSRWRMPRYAPLAAGIVLAVAVGAIAGATALSSLRPDTSTATAQAANETHALKATVAQLTSEVTTLKTALSSAQRTTTSQVGKLSDRLDRAEKAQSEPAAKIAKITETVDRLEKKQQQAAAAPPPAPVAVAAADPDVTGSIRKEDSRPPVAEGWRLVDFYQGRAVVESRNGALFEVGPGSNLPGLGKVETIKRENGRVVVVAKNGTILASAEPRRLPPPYVPYRY